MYYQPSNPIFYTFFNDKTYSRKCKLSYSYSYIAGNNLNEGCFVGSKTKSTSVGPTSAQTINFAFKSIDEVNDDIEQTYVWLHILCKHCVTTIKVVHGSVGLWLVAASRGMYDT